MNQMVFSRDQLPMEVFRQLGLASGDKIALDEEDMQALLAGRRTDMLRLEGLRLGAAVIPALDAKLSLRMQGNGTAELLLHPIYREPEVPALLTASEAEMLERGQAANLLVTGSDDEGNPCHFLVEFDADTREFIITDTSRILAPDEVNGLPLTVEQKGDFRRGKMVRARDGTTFQYTGTDRQGVRSDRLALVASLLIDGGVSFVLYKGLYALFGQKADRRDESSLSKEFYAALRQIPELHAKMQAGMNASYGRE